MTDDLTIRTLTADDLTAFAATLAAAFLADEGPLILESERLVFEPERSHGVFDGDRMIGVGQVMTRRMTVPGGPVPVAAVTSIGVAPDHRRRGALTRIMRAQLHGLHDAGQEAVAALWASESVIYGRFGYGSASRIARATMLGRAPLRAGIDLGADRVREVPREEALPLIRAIYEEAAPQRIGMLDRDDGDWAYHLLDDERRRASRSSLRFALHPQGYAVFRVKSAWGDRGPDGELTVRELVSTTPVAHAALYRYLLDYDLVARVAVEIPLDDPLQHMLANSRGAVSTIGEGLWIRLVDVDRALAARHYRAPVDVVVEITDELCPWNAGTWRLTAGSGGGATVVRTADPADLAADVADLGAAYLGGTRLDTLAAAGRVRERTPGAVEALSAALLGEREPACLEVF